MFLVISYDVLFGSFLMNKSLFSASDLICYKVDSFSSVFLSFDCVCCFSTIVVDGGG